MTLDSWMVGRLARELHELLAGARVTDVSAGRQRLTIACYRRRAQPLLQASFDPARPIAAVIETPAAANENGPGGWAGGVAPLLRGSVVDMVHAVPNDRILNVDMSSRSAFGVPARHRVVLELEPRKANALVLRPAAADVWTILAAAKQFDGADDARSLVVGEAYRLPPPRPRKLDRDAFLTAVAAALAPADVEMRVIARLLGEYDPSCTPPLARDVAERALAADTEADRGELMLALWSELRAQVEEKTADLAAPVFAYRRGDEITACHVVPLAWAAGDCVRAPSVNAVCEQDLATADRTRVAPASTALKKKLALMLSRCDVEVAGLRAAQARAQAAQELRVAGDAIYANITAIQLGSSSLVTPQGVRITLDPLLTPKQNAAGYFRRYKKARSGLPRIAARIAALAANKEYWEQLVWELERAAAEPSLRAVIYEDVADAIGAKNVGSRFPVALKKARSRSSNAQRRGGIKETAAPGVALPDGAVAYVGRSPKDNERLTFSVGRPNDYWFHARGIPGAHVILKLAHAGAQPTPEQIEGAAALAAGASRAGRAVKVEVDYTQRKHVRRRGKGKTGLVWYTDFKTVSVSPQKR